MSASFCLVMVKENKVYHLKEKERRISINPKSFLVSGKWVFWREMVEIWRKGLVLVLFTVCILGCANAATDQGDGLCYFPFAFSPYSLRFLYSAYGYPFLPNLCDFCCCFFGSLSAFSLKRTYLIALPFSCQNFVSFVYCLQRFHLAFKGGFC